MLIFSIDPGTDLSAFTLYCSAEKKVVQWAKLPNEDLLCAILNHEFHYSAASVERVACYGMAVGKEVFSTCFWTGKFLLALAMKSGEYFRGHEPLLIERREVKIHLCNSMKAKDGNIRQAVIDLIGPQGSKRQPGPTYGVAGDGWASLALAITTAHKINSTAAAL